MGKYYTAVQGGFGPDPGREEGRRAARQLLAAQEQALAKTAAIVGLPVDSCTTLQYKGFLVLVSGGVSDGKTLPDSVVTGLLSEYWLDIKAPPAAPILAACTRVAAEIDKQGNNPQLDKGEFINMFISEAQRCLNDCPVTAHMPLQPELSSRLSNFIKALGYMKWELTWPEQYLFNPNPHPSRTL